MRPGWNIIAYFPGYELDASAPDFYVLSPIIDRVEIAKDGLGRFLTPEHNFSNMEPWEEGQGYQVKIDWDEPIILNYPEEREEIFAVQQSLPADRLHEINPTDRNMSLLIDAIHGIDLSDVECIIAESQTGKLIGQGILNGNRYGLAIWGDDPNTDEIEGALEGETFSLKAIAKSTGNTIPMRVERILKGDGCIYAENGFSVIETFAQEIVPDRFFISECYPNPFNATTRFIIELPEKSQIEIDAFDLSGRRIEEIAHGEYKAGAHDFSWNADGLTNGIYIFRLDTESYSGVRKVVLMK